MFTKLSSKYVFICACISAGVSSYSPKAFGNPALGCADTLNEVFCDNVCKYGFNKSAPRAQLKPTLNNGICEIETKKASTVCPESVLPEASVMVPETIIGISILRSSFTSSIAKRAALAFKVSKIVSTNKISLPPSINASTCCLYAIRKSSKVTALYPGSFTSGDILAVLFVGPIEPATKRGLSGFLAVNSSATSRASLADS